MLYEVITKFNIDFLTVNGHQGILHLADGIGNGFGVGIESFADHGPGALNLGFAIAAIQQGPCQGSAQSSHPVLKQQVV